MNTMGESVAVLYEDEFSTTDLALQATLAQIPTLRIISEAELEHDEPHGKTALIFVQEARVASAVDRIANLKQRLPSLRLLVALQAMNATNLGSLVEAGADAFISGCPSPDELCTALALLHFSKKLSHEAGMFARKANKKADSCFTRRETEILLLLSSGFSNKDVARRLDVSVRTVETHRLNLRRKTKTGRLKDLISLARTLRLTPDLDVELSEGRCFAQQDARLVSRDCSVAA